MQLLHPLFPLAQPVARYRLGASRHSGKLASAAVLLGLVSLAAGTLRSTPIRSSGGASSHLAVMEKYGKLPISFEPNQGQTDSRIQFLTKGDGYTLFLTGKEAVLSLGGREGSNPQDAGQTEAAEGRVGASGAHPQSPIAGRHSSKEHSPAASLRMRLVGANPHARTEGAEALPGKVNYLIGNDRKKWHAGIRTFARVRENDVYPGIDLVYYGNQSGRLEHDFTVHPGADPGQIRVSYSGAESARIDGNGDLVLKTAAGEVRQQKPVAYQETNGKRVPVACAYVLNDEKTDGGPPPSRKVRPSGATANSSLRPADPSGSPVMARFVLAGYDPTRTLVIDPVLVYSTYLGIYTAVSRGIAVDASGNAYVTGYATPTAFPTTAGAFHTTSFTYGAYTAFVTKLSADGSYLAYSTYVGGTGTDECAAIAVDSSGSAYVTGQTTSTNFPTTPGAFQMLSRTPGLPTSFVTKLLPGGNDLAYSTYLGGSYQDTGNGIAVDPSGSAYVTGFTLSQDFPTTPGAFQTANRTNIDAEVSTGFVSKLAPDGRLAYSTYLGGSSGDAPAGIAVDSSGSAYVAGQSFSADFPTTPGAFQMASNTTHGTGFVTKLSTDGSSLAYSTFVSGSAQDGVSGIAIDAAGHAYLTGSTSSADFPVTSGAFQTSKSAVSAAFISKLSVDGTSLVFSAYLSSRGQNAGTGIAVDSTDSVVVVGRTGASNFPVTADALQTSWSGGTGANNGFVTKLSADGSSLVYSTYFGGSNRINFTTGVAVDAAGGLHVTGYTNSSDFPTTSGAFESEKLAVGPTAFIAKFGISSPPVALNQNYRGIASSTLCVDAANGVLNGDTNPSSLPLRAFLVDGPVYGAVTLNPDGSFTYTPPSGYVGYDYFRYQAFDEAQMYSAPASVYIEVQAAPPTHLALSASTVPSPAWVNVPLTYVLTVSNQGPSDESGIAVTGSVGGTTASLVSAVPSAGSVSTASGISWTGIDLANGASATLTLTVRPTSTGSIAFQFQRTPGPLPDPSSDDQSVSSTVPVNRDSTPPAWGTPASAVSGGIATVTVPVQDTGSGLATIAVLSATNCRITWTTLTPGATTPLTVTATKINQSQKASFSLQATDVAGNVSSLDPLVAQLIIPRGAQSVTRTFEGIPAAEHLLTLTNGTLRQFSVTVNDGKRQTVPLTNGQSVSLNLASQMTRKKNRVTITATGPSGSTATVLLADEGSASGAATRALTQAW